MDWSYPILSDVEFYTQFLSSECVRYKNGSAVNPSVVQSRVRALGEFDDAPRKDGISRIVNRVAQDVELRAEPLGK